ncbi:hypothetical protein [Dyella japonica]|uniref:Uncharacterized protein n=1 Tax=Dyella japonica A8 TaxID=1217721 RepID=A0A075JX32_9GAMM|nr:hypothetical protein [Dyella japonica]AIF46052.1 hypothetical protein HY57_01615 [Dyella japonica A8]
MLSREQADTIADAVMANGKERQRERAQRREVERQQERMRRRWAVAILLIMLVGAFVARLMGQHLLPGIVTGGIVGQLAALSRNAWRASLDDDR